MIGETISAATLVTVPITATTLVVTAITTAVFVVFAMLFDGMSVANS